MTERISIVQKVVHGIVFYDLSIAQTQILFIAMG
jgi:hypothetical protein